MSPRLFRLPAAAFAAAISLSAASAAIAASSSTSSEELRLNDLEYLAMPGLNVMLAQDSYPEGHQGGVTVILNDQRIAANGDVRLEPTPGQWGVVPVVGKRVVDRATQTISVHMQYPDETKDRKGFNPLVYPDLRFGYTVRVKPEGKAFRLIVDLDSVLPPEWEGKVAFNLELFPGVLFGKSYYIDNTFGVFPRQPNGPGGVDERFHNPEDPFATGYHVAPLGIGKRLTVAPESDALRLSIESIHGGELELLDGRAQHNNGWFIVRSTTAPGATTHAIEWLVRPHAIPGWIHQPVVQVSQVGYAPAQQKIAVIELDRQDAARPAVQLLRVSEQGGEEKVLEQPGSDWGNYLRYHYLRFDFSSVHRPGMYIVRYGAAQSSPFEISDTVFDRNVWQPTLEYFLPVQMCHMRVNDQYRVWHGACHLDDARMAPINYNHFDGYIQGPSTLTKYQPGEHVPGLDRGGWHDAGDHDLRVESQSDTIYGLALAYETFGCDYDNTTIDQENRIVQIHQPDGKPDILQQIEHGALSIVGGYNAMGRLYRGIQTASLRQYVILGDPVNQTDGKVFDPKKYPNGNAPKIGLPGSPDDNLVFTEDNPERQLEVAAGLASASRALHNFNTPLADDCLRIAKELWNNSHAAKPSDAIAAATELLITTHDSKYADYLRQHADEIAQDFDSVGWVVGRTFPLISDPTYHSTIEAAAKKYREQIGRLDHENPYGVPFDPDYGGAGWDIQHFGVQQYFLHTAWPSIFPDTYMLNALNFMLGVHPGSNPATFVSGVGAKSLIPGYGFNRADWSYVPGGIASGTAVIRPDFPELMEWPYFWQQREYVLGWGTSDFVFLAMAAQHNFANK